MRSISLLFIAIFFTCSLLPLHAEDVSPLELLQQGLESMFEERYDDAIRSFESVLQYDANNEAAQLGLKGAREKREQAIVERRSEEKPALEAARKAMSMRDWPEAVDRLSGVIARQADHPAALSLMRDIRARMEKQREKSKPQSGDWYYAMGVLSYMDGDWLKAVDSWDQVVAFNPDQIGLLSKIDQAKERLKDKEKSDRIFFLQSEGFDSLKKGDYEQAIASWNQLLALDPGNDQALGGVAEAQKAWAEQKQRDQKEQVQKLTEKAMDAYIEKDRAGSVVLWRQVLELDPDNTLARDYLRRMGVGAQDSGTVAAASSGYDKALRFLADGRYPEAVEYLERYIAKYPNDQRARTAMADVAARQKNMADKFFQDGLKTYSQGDIQAAIAHWQDALRTDPDYQRARQAIIKAMAEQKKRQK
jgi:tetratricopeptide (TPR) repeat protein